MRPLTQYVIVRRNLEPAAAIVAVAHAAGEAFYCLRSSEKEHLLDKQEVAGSSPAEGSTFNPAETIVVVLGIRNETRLANLARKLDDRAIAHVIVRENDSIDAIGLVPCERERVRPFVSDLQAWGRS